MFIIMIVTPFISSFMMSWLVGEVYGVLMVNESMDLKLEERSVE